MEPLGDDDRALDALWRGLYGEPLPIRGAANLALRIIIDQETSRRSRRPFSNASREPHRPTPLP